MKSSNILPEEDLISKIETVEGIPQPPLLANSSRQNSLYHQQVEKSSCQYQNRFRTWYNSLFLIFVLKSK